MTATEAALCALVAVLAAGPGLPAPRRNTALDSLAEECMGGDGASLLSALIVQDGDNAQAVRIMGDPPRWELVHHAEIDWAVAGPEGVELESAFDLGLQALGAAIAANPTLGGTVVLAEIATPPERGLEVWGAKTAKTALVRVELTYGSDFPF